MDSMDALDGMDLIDWMDGMGAEVCAVEVGAFGELFMGEVQRLPARADVVSEFSEGRGGWHPWSLAECGLSGHGR